MAPAESAEDIEQRNEAADGQQLDKFHFFWKSGSPFSQWHPSKYTLNGVEYSCAEQGMMHGKALLFEDEEVSAQILETTSPREMKALGRLVRFFEPKIWNQHRVRIVYDNTVAKFTQNPHLLQALLNTQGLLVEASPSDAIWGIGLAESNARKMSPERWPGLNLLGRILTQVRDEIREGFHDVLIADGQKKETEEETMLQAAH